MKYENKLLTNYLHGYHIPQLKNAYIWYYQEMYPAEWENWTWVFELVVGRERYSKRVSAGIPPVEQIRVIDDLVEQWKATNES